MKIRSSAILIALYIFAMSFGAAKAEARTIPDFTSCGNPQGSMKASYDSGMHGIPGDTDEYTGSDKVYEIAPGVYTQCFCPTDGNGIQTNWLKATDFSNDEIEILKKEGWIYIANGSVWGLEDCPYLAKNSNYSCKTTTTPTPTPTPGTTTSNNGGTGGSTNVLAAATNVLAPTGNVFSIYLAFVFAFVSLLAYVLLQRRSSK